MRSFSDPPYLSPEISSSLEKPLFVVKIHIIFTFSFSQYANGRIHDIRGAAEGMESSGVYPGCGSACVLLNRPCNYGKCEDQYNDFKCNCTVSPYTGKYCQNSKLAYDLSLITSSLVSAVIQGISDHPPFHSGIILR